MIRRSTARMWQSMDVFHNPKIFFCEIVAFEFWHLRRRQICRCVFEQTAKVIYGIKRIEWSFAYWSWKSYFWETDDLCLLIRKNKLIQTYHASQIQNTIKEIKRGTGLIIKHQRDYMIDRTDVNFDYTTLEIKGFKKNERWQFQH